MTFIIKGNCCLTGLSNRRQGKKTTVGLMLMLYCALHVTMCLASCTLGSLTNMPHGLTHCSYTQIRSIVIKLHQDYTIVIRKEKLMKQTMPIQKKNAILMLALFLETLNPLHFQRKTAEQQKLVLKQSIFGLVNAIPQEAT